MENITGKVVKGIQKGRTLGFPTANIKTNSNIEAGIYAGYVIADNKKYSAALYFPGNKIAEAYIFDFEGNLYGKEVNVEIIKKIRDKKIFKNDKEAKDQIAKDVIEIKKWTK